MWIVKHREYIHTLLISCISAILSFPAAIKSIISMKMILIMMIGCLFNDAVSTSYYKPTLEWQGPMMLVMNELERILKDVTVTSFDVLPQNLPMVFQKYISQFDHALS